MRNEKLTVINFFCVCIANNKTKSVACQERFRLFTLSSCRYNSMNKITDSSKC